MQEWDKYRLVKITRGDLIDQIKNCSEKDWIKALNRLDVIVSTEYGRGHHAVAFKDNCPPTDNRCVIATLVNIQPNIQRDIFKKVLTYGLESKKYNEDDIWNALGVKIKRPRA